MTAYFCEGIHARSWIKEAEELQKANPQDQLCLGVRAYYTCALSVALVETAVNAIFTTLLFLPYVAATALLCCGKVPLCKRVQAQFHRVLTRTQGSVIVAAIASPSIFRTGTSVQASSWLADRMDSRWQKYCQKTQESFKKRAVSLSQRRANSVSEAEIYRLQGKTQFEILAGERLGRVQAYLLTASQALPQRTGVLTLAELEQRYADLTVAKELADKKISARREELKSLPLTYLETIRWDVKQAELLASKAVKKIGKHTEVVLKGRVARYGKKFDQKSFLTASKLYAEKVQKELFDKVAVCRKNEQDFIAQWKQEVGGAKPNERDQKIRQVVSSRFVSLHHQCQSFKHTYNRTCANSVRKLEGLAQPAWYTRAWRAFGYGLSWFPSLHKQMDGYLDPDFS